MSKQCRETAFDADSGLYGRQIFYGGSRLPYSLVAYHEVMQEIRLHEQRDRGPGIAT